MILGHVRDYLPRITLPLPGYQGIVNVEFVVDTGFDGELALPPDLIQKIDAVLVGEETALMPGLVRRRVARYEVQLEWHGEERVAELIVLEGRPLIGAALLDGFLLRVEMTDGGEVVIESL